MYHMAIELHSSTQELEKHGIGAVEYQTIWVVKTIQLVRVVTNNNKII